MDERTDLEFIREEFSWPLWPMLPVKNRQGNWKQAGGWPTLGTILSKSLTIVYKESIDEILIESKRNPDFKPTILKQYSSLEELVADGWIVD